ncbi:MAG TPA: hypothetical protein VEL31_18425, partial [Ktedonobacteraceae bacterium]|nr:hypothetical protein [Ktedonobacteraceae bacterium]
ILPEVAYRSTFCPQAPVAPDLSRGLFRKQGPCLRKNNLLLIQRLVVLQLLRAPWGQVQVST